jgi:sialic acid synthase SpsE
MRIGKHELTPGYCYVVAEIGVNHNGSMDIAKALIDVAHAAGCDAVKFQKRTPELVVAKDKWDVVRETPFGPMPTIEYRRRMEFDFRQYKELTERANSLGMDLFASAWDVESVAFLEQLSVPAFKVPGAKNDDILLLEAVAHAAQRLTVPVVLSTAFCTLAEVTAAVDVVRKAGAADVVLLQCTGSYPCPDDDIGLRGIDELRRLGLPVGYSGHEAGFLPTVLAATVFDAVIVERHVTLDRGMPGSDHGASLEPRGLTLLVRDIRRSKALMADMTHKSMRPSEAAHAKRLGR